VIHSDLKIQCIYSINHVSGRRYIGSTNNLSRRMREHLKLLRDGNHSSPHFQRSFRKYGENSFAVEVLELVNDESELEAIEQACINRFNRRQLYNGSVVVRGRGSRVNSRKPRRKVFLIKHGASLEFLDSVSAGAFLGCHYTKVNQALYLSTRCRGWYVSRDDVSLAEFESRKTKKPIYCFSKTGNLLRIFKTQTEAAEWCNISASAINNVINNRGYIKSAGGYLWSRSNSAKPFRHASHKKIAEVRPDGTRVFYNSMSEASSANGVKLSAFSRRVSIGSVVNGVRWEYAAT
jgi:group I intron endonuclease